MAGQLPLEQLVVVRIHCPQHKKLPPREGVWIKWFSHPVEGARPLSPAQKTPSS
jgi:hypothetical protein